MYRIGASQPDIEIWADGYENHAESNSKHKLKIKKQGEKITYT